jgi:tetratricopeptide (TPR) repeat protein
MRKATLTVIIALALGLAQAAGLAASPRAQSGTDESLFREAKLLVFDKSWQAALDKLDELVDRFPASPLAGQALYYKGECLSGLGGRERDALRAYKSYVKLADAKPSLVEESEGSIVDLALELYEGGDAGAIRDVESRLEHPNKVVRYYAAYKLSLVGDKKIAAKAAPVLSRIVESEKDPELLDRARIALLRVSPESLKSAEDRKPRTVTTARLLRIRVRKEGMKEPAFSLNIPFALADLALSAMDEDDKAAIRKKGYDINKILNELAKSKESILRIAGDDGTIIEIWID